MSCLCVCESGGCDTRVFSVCQRSGGALYCHVCALSCPRGNDKEIIWVASSLRREGAGGRGHFHDPSTHLEAHVTNPAKRSLCCEHGLASISKVRLK